MTKKGSYILIIAMAMLIMMSIMLIFMINEAHENFEDNITVKQNGVTESVIPVRNLTLTPGASKEYQVNLVCGATGHFLIDLDYEEDKDGGMKHFVNVRIYREGVEEPVYYGSLSELIDEDKIVSFDGNLYEDDPLEIRFVYEMPLSTGNEAQGTFADFDIHLSVEKS